MKFRVKADKDSSLYFIEYYGGSYPQFIINDSPGWETQAKIFDTWQDANEVSKHFSGYIEEIKENDYIVYFDSTNRFMYSRFEFVDDSYIIKFDLTENEAKEMASDLNDVADL